MSFKFGHNILSPSVVFLKTELSYAFVNRSPVADGHVLISPLRLVKRFHELTTDEVKDMFGVVHRISRPMERHYGASAMTIAVQDGQDAGQTVQHVHIHLIPRRRRDFPENDSIYEKLDSHDKVERKIRPLHEMESEATALRRLFSSSNGSDAIPS